VISKNPIFLIGLMKLVISANVNYQGIAENTHPKHTCCVSLYLIILSLNRAPSGDFQQFLRGLDATLKHLYNPKTEFLIW
jgi:hypothetical protein